MNTDERDAILAQGKDEDNEETYIEAILDLAREVEQFAHTPRYSDTDDLVEWLDDYGQGNAFDLPILPAALAAEFDDRRMTVAEVASDLGLSVAYVRRMLRWGKIPASFETGRWTVDPTLVVDYVRKTQKPKIVKSTTTIEADNSGGYSLRDVPAQYGDRREAKRIFSAALPGATGKIKFVLTYDNGKTCTIQYRVTASGARKVYEMWED